MKMKIYYQTKIGKLCGGRKRFVQSINFLSLSPASGVWTKDHVYRMVIVEGRCTMTRLSSLGANCSLVDTKV